MKRIFFLAVLLGFLGAARAQKIYFIYIQADNNSPFFVKMGDKVSSSTAVGYLILPKLVDSTYQFTVGRTGQAAAESRFSVTMAKKDRGFLLRESDGKFSLFDLQALTSLQPLAATNTSTEIIGKRTDPFTVLLAQAAADPSLLEVRAAPAVALQGEGEKKAEVEPVAAVITQAETETPKPDEDTMQEPAVANTNTNLSVENAPETVLQGEDTITQTNVAVNESTPVQVDSAMQQPETAVVKAAETDTVREPAAVYKRSVVTRRSESSTSEGFGLVFWDAADGVVDTIRLIIPNRNIVAKEESGHGDLKKFLDFTNSDATKELKAGDQNNSDGETEKLSVAVNADSIIQEPSLAQTAEGTRKAEKKAKRCTSEADEKAFFKLRKAMAAKEDEEAMINEANKAFRRVCFSTGQIKNLSALFLTAGGKYHFFDAAYGHVSDKEQYAVLQSELTDEYYKNRFKSLIAQQ